MRNPGDILEWLDVALTTHSDTYEYSVIKDAIEEIERLRAGQFRWIEVSEGKQPGHTEWILARSGLNDIHLIRSDHVYRAVYTHWAPIPPLPERTQEEKDEALWKKHVNSPDCCSDPYGLPNYRLTFLAGLKAARGEK